MSLYIATDKNIKNKIKGIFNDKSVIEKDNCYIIPYKSNITSLDNNNMETIYLFFQYMDGECRNIKMFSCLQEAINYRDNNFSYGHIL